MIKSSISSTEAIRLLVAGSLTSDFSISFGPDDQIDAANALKLGKLGYDVPDNIIVYPDDLEDDDDFEGEWEPINSDVEDHKKQVKIKLDIDPEVEEWLSNSSVDLDSLVSELITGFYKSSKIVNS